MYPASKELVKRKFQSGTMYPETNECPWLSVDEDAKLGKGISK